MHGPRLRNLALVGAIAVVFGIVVWMIADRVLQLGERLAKQLRRRSAKSVVTVELRSPTVTT